MQTRWQTMQILWGALTVSHLLLAGTLWFVRFGPSAQPLADAPPPMFVPLFAMIAFVEGGVSFFLPRFQLQQAAKKHKIGRDPSEEQILRLMPTAQTGLILGLALCEAISLLGFILGFLGAPPMHFAPFFAAGLLLALPRFPGETWLRSQLPDTQTL
jgi:hypothetical protein